MTRSWRDPEYLSVRIRQSVIRQLGVCCSCLEKQVRERHLACPRDRSCATGRIRSFRSQIRPSRSKPAAFDLSASWVMLQRPRSAFRSNSNKNHPALFSALGSCPSQNTSALFPSLEKCFQCISSTTPGTTPWTAMSWWHHPALCIPHC